MAYTGIRFRHPLLGTSKGGKGHAQATHATWFSRSMPKGEVLAAVDTKILDLSNPFYTLGIMVGWYAVQKGHTRFCRTNFIIHGNHSLAPPGEKACLIRPLL